MLLDSKITKRWVARSILAVCIFLPTAAEAQRRKPKPAPPAPSATPATTETAPPPTPPPAATPAPLEPPPTPSPAAPAPAPATEPPPAAPAPTATVETHIKPAPPPPPVVRSVTTPVIVSGIIAGAGLASGVVFAILAAGDHSKYKDKPDHDVALSGEQNAFIADVSFGVAALFGLTALALYMLPDEPAPAEAPKTGASSHGSWAKAALKGEVLRF